jgi:hypothetical protein
MHIRKQKRQDKTRAQGRHNILQGMKHLPLSKKITSFKKIFTLHLTPPPSTPNLTFQKNEFKCNLMSAVKNEGIWEGFDNILDRLDQNSNLLSYAKNGDETVDLSNT